MTRHALTNVWNRYRSQRARGKSSHAPTLAAEVLEARQLLSGTASIESLVVASTSNDESQPESSASFVSSQSTQSVTEVGTAGYGDRSSQQQNDVVLAWNNLFSELLVANESNQNPGYASRAMAMLNLAIYDAVTLANGDADDTFYNYNQDTRQIAGIDAEATASQAAYTVLSSLYPEQQQLIDEFQTRFSSSLRHSSSASASVRAGTTIGEQIIAARMNDGSDGIVDYSFTEGAGYFQADPLNPDVPVWGPGWGQVDPFLISSAEDFAPESPPDLSSAEYAASFAEVLELGSIDSESRTSDQTEAGIFWAYDRVGLGTPMALFGEVLESIAIQEGNTLEQNAALFAQASVAMADAGVVAWHSKFDEQFWRPVTAIHAANTDGNPATEADTGWTALGAPDGGDDIIGFTPQFPTYVSGHATFGGALFGAIRDFYGRDNIAFEVSSNELEILMDNPELQEAYGLELDDASRSFSSLTEAMAENGRSRVYLGIHFDFDDLVGQEVGQAVASSVASAFVVADDHGDHHGKGQRPRRQRTVDRSEKPGLRPSADDGRDGGRMHQTLTAAKPQQDTSRDRKQQGADFGGDNESGKAGPGTQFTPFPRGQLQISLGHILNKSENSR